MPRNIQERWCDRDKAWLVPLGEYSEASRRRKYIALRDEAGEKVREHDRAAAKAALLRLLQAEEARERRRGGPTVNDVIVAYLRWHREQGSAERTIDGHLYHLKRFGEFEVDGVPLGIRAAASIELRDLSRMRKAMEARKVDSSYVRHLYMSVKACWSWASRPVEDREPERLIASNPFDRLKTPGPGRGTEKFVPVDVVRQLMAYANAKAPNVHPNGRRHFARWLVALKLIVYSGCRPSEAAGLRWDEVDWDERIVIIPPPKLRGKVAGRTHKTGRKTGRFRRIDVRPEVLADLQALRDDPASHPVWPFQANGAQADTAPTTRQMGVWFQSLRDAAIKAGVPLPEECTLYWFRHTWQTLGVSVASAEAVALAAGNTREVVMSTYVSAQNAQVRDIGDKVAALYEGKD